MQNAGVRQRLRRLLAMYSKNERMLDAYWQWATNPTPGSAGYALEENCGFIATNLLLRYGQPAIELLFELAESIQELRQEASVEELQQAFIGLLGGRLGQPLRDGVKARLALESPARRLLVAWLINRATWMHRQDQELVNAGELDWSLGVDLKASAKDVRSTVATAIAGPEARAIDLCREAIAAGVANRLFFRSADGRMEPKLRPGPRIQLRHLTY